VNDGRIRLEIHDNVAELVFNTPSTYNSLDIAMMSDFSERVVSLGSDKKICGIIITGSGKSFCCGGDLRWISGFEAGPSAAVLELSRLFHRGITEIHKMSKPVVAAINGVAAGGGFSLALACDFRVMAKTATLKLGYTSNGLSIDGGGTTTLPRIVGVAKALEIAAFDRPMTAEEAFDLGMVTRVVEDKDVMGEARELVRNVLQKPLYSYGWSKRLMNESFDNSFELQLEKERDALSSCASNENGIEGIRAFIEKRKPNFNKKIQSQ
jgi:2-(1,2-epoxy-1,2-dihydrophenyl)acetyl-CoA isomerase